MSYSFKDRYCKITANLPEQGIVVINGWITDAEGAFLFIMDENNNHTLIKREQLVGSIVVLEEQKTVEREKGKVECEKKAIVSEN